MSRYSPILKTCWSNEPMCQFYYSATFEKASCPRCFHFPSTLSCLFSHPKAMFSKMLTGWISLKTRVSHLSVDGKLFAKMMTYSCSDIHVQKPILYHPFFSLQSLVYKVNGVFSSTGAQYTVSHHGLPELLRPSRVDCVSPAPYQMMVVMHNFVVC